MLGRLVMLTEVGLHEKRPASKLTPIRCLTGKKKFNWLLQVVPVRLTLLLGNFG